MKYHLFAYDQYYPGGGMDDYRGSFETLTEAKKQARGWDMADIVVIEGDTIKPITRYTWVSSSIGCDWVTGEEYDT